jgi:hypothetical protein
VATTKSPAKSDRVSMIARAFSFYAESPVIITAPVEMSGVNFH